MPRRKVDREQQAAVPVTDKSAERGINLQTILTSGVLIVMTGAWNTLSEMNDKLASVEKSMAVMEDRATTLRQDFDRHRMDPYAHNRLRQTPR